MVKEVPQRLHVLGNFNFRGLSPVASTIGHLEISEDHHARFVAELERIEQPVPAGKEAFQAAEGEPLETPPNAEFLLRMFLPRETRENMIGDLEEDFRTNLLPRHGPFWARFLYLWDVSRTIIAAVWEKVRWFVGAGFVAKAADWMSQKLSGG